MTKTLGGLHGWRAFFLFCLLVPASPLWADNPATVLELPQVEVIGTTPLPGIGVPLTQVPANVQGVTSDQISRQRSLDVTDYMNQNLGAVNINDTQNNPFQPDVNFRGFTASPTLGTPQGLSVFVDGVRVNEAFGDIVNWDLIPQSAIASMNVIPGSNPVFGLNTLGGALAVNTKSGFEFPGTSMRATGGAFGRKALEFETGGHGERADYFVSGNVFNEGGWADHNPSRVKQLFAKTGYQNDTSDIDLSFTYGDTRLEGNQTLPLSFLDNPKQAYTFPDITTNRLAFFNLKGSHFLRQDLLVAANAYYRKLTANIFNSNINNDFDVTTPPGPGNEPASNVINDFSEWRSGAGVQLTSLHNLAERKNNLTVGLSYDRGNTDFKQFNQEASIALDRGTFSDAPAVLATSLHATNSYYGLYLTDTFSFNDKTHLTVSGRYNRATLKLEDQLGTALNGDHSFQRFNPAVGLTYNPTSALTTYVAYNEGMRVPSPMELTCADPNAPCSLPNAFLSDPALKAVLSKTWEAGARGRLGEQLRWSAAVFRTNLDNDIQFISSGGGATSAGFFQNVGQTQRQGIELGMDGKLDKITLSAHYSLIDATFETPLIVNSPNNSSAQPLTCATCSDVLVSPGNRIPGIPKHLLKVRAEYGFTEKFAIGMNVIAQSNQFARGDENNHDVNGPVPGFAVVNLDARYELGGGWDIFARLNNLFDRSYETFGVLGQNVFTGPNNTFDFTGASFRPEQFRAVAAPRAGWIGIAYRFGGPGNK